MVARFYLVDSDCLTVSYILTRLVISSLICASPPLFRFRCFDFALEFDGSILQVVVLIVYSGMDVSECNLCIKKIDKPCERFLMEGKGQFNVLSETLTLLCDVPRGSKFICIRQS